MRARRWLVLAMLVAMVALPIIAACEGSTEPEADTDAQEPAAQQEAPEAEGPGATAMDEPKAAEKEPVAASPGEGDAGVGHGSHLSPDAYVIEMEPLGHWHVNNAKKLVFTVKDASTGDPAPEQDLVVQITRAEGGRVTERSVSEDQVVSEGNGTYSLEYTPTSFVPHAFTARFEDEGQVFASSAWVAEIAKAGDEGIRADIGDTSYVYQLRYHWDPGHIHASDTESASMVFEIMRGVQEGSEINWEQPWRNTFDHIVDADHPEVIITSHDGTVSDEVHPTYSGKGIYTAERIFPPDEMGHDGGDYEVTFRFTDPYNGAEVQNPEGYHLHVASPH